MKLSRSPAVRCARVLPAWAQRRWADRAGSIAGRVLRPDGLPQPDAEVVAATRGTDGRLRLSSWRARTAFDGQYAITGRARRPLPGARARGRRRRRWRRAAGGDALSRRSVTEPGTPVEVFPGVPVAGVDIWLQPSPRRFQVAGRVVDPAGGRSRTSPSSSARRESRADNVWTLTDPGGLFTLSAWRRDRSCCARAPTRPTVRWWASRPCAGRRVCAGPAHRGARAAGRVRGRASSRREARCRRGCVCRSCRRCCARPRSTRPEASPSTRRGRSRRPGLPASTSCASWASAGLGRPRAGPAPRRSSGTALADAGAAVDDLPVKSVRIRLQRLDPLESGCGRTGSTMRPEGSA